MRQDPRGPASSTSPSRPASKVEREVERDLDRHSNLRRPFVVVLAAILIVGGLAVAASLFVRIAGAVIAPGELRVTT